MNRSSTEVVYASRRRLDSRYRGLATTLEIGSWAEGSAGTLVARSEEEGLWTLQAGIFPENAASIELHRRAGFRLVGTRERLGYLGGRWCDVLLMERRSPKGGVEVTAPAAHRHRGG